MEKKNLIFLKFLLSFIDTQIDDTASKADALIRRMLKKYKWMYPILAHQWFYLNLTTFALKTLIIKESKFS